MQRLEKGAVCFGGSHKVALQPPLPCPVLSELGLENSLPPEVKPQKCIWRGGGGGEWWLLGSLVLYVLAQKNSARSKVIDKK